MRFRVGRETLGEAVAWVARALPARPVVPVLSGLLLEAGSAGLTLSCFDYEVSARVRIDADVEEAGTALVPGRLLAEIIRSLPARPAEFSSDRDMVSLVCGSAEFTVVSLPIADYPALPEPPPPAGTVEGAALAVAASQVVPAASRDDTLPMLTAVCLDVDGETLTLAATDRYRLAVRELSWAPAVPGIRTVAMVPARTLADVARTMAAGVPVTLAFGIGQPGADAGGAASLPTAASEGSAQRQAGTMQRAGAHEPRSADGMISFEAGGRRLIARLIAGEFIRYRSRFPAEFGCRAEMPAVAFTEAVRRVSLVAERASPVRLAFSSGSVVIEAQAEGRARAVETVAATFDGDERVISFNPHYLLDGLGAAAAGAPGRSAGARTETSAGTVAAAAGEAAEAATATEAAAAGNPDSAAVAKAESAAAAKAESAAAAKTESAAAAKTESAAAAKTESAAAAKTDSAAAAEPDSAAAVEGDSGTEAGAGGSHQAPAAGRIRLDFTSPAKPALITWSSDDTAVSSRDERPDGGAAGLPAFRYLLVPLRVPARA